MPVIFKTAVNQNKKLLIKLTNCIDIGEQDINFFGSEDFIVEKVNLKITYDDAQIVNVLFLSCYQFLDYFSSFV